ncbi:MAG: hypothetical protein M9897_12160 [Brumimicrobium sp.]|nr:hypothetical protein [Brumimicrobium sp.]
MKQLIINHLYSSNKFVAWILFTSVIMFFLGCKKDLIQTNENTSSCISISAENCGNPFGMTYISADTIAGGSSRCYFNPNNDNEFLYTKATKIEGGAGISNSMGIFKYNITTGQSTLIYNGEIWSFPKWSKKDWIIFNLPDQNIYKVKSNGDSLTQLTYLNDLHSPEWNNDGTQFVAFSASNAWTYLFDESGNILDTLYFSHSQLGNYQNPKYIIENTIHILSFFNMENKAIEYQLDYSSLSTSSVWGSVFWLDDETVIYSNENGLNQFNINTKVNKIIKKSCNARIYLSGNINQSKTKMIWERIDRKLINDCTIEFSNQIYIMNIDGTNEQKIEIK